MPVAPTGPPCSYLPGPRAVPCFTPHLCLLGLGFASRLLRGPPARLAFAAAASRSGRSHPRPSGSDNPGCPPPRLCVPLAPALTQPAALRHSHASRSPGLSAPRTRAHTHPGSEPAAGKPSPRAGTQRPNPQPRRPRTLSPHPLFLAVTRSHQSTASQAGASSLLCSPQLCALPFPTTLSARPLLLSPPAFAPQPDTHARISAHVSKIPTDAPQLSWAT